MGACVYVYVTYECMCVCGLPVHVCGYMYGYVGTCMLDVGTCGYMCDLHRPMYGYMCVYVAYGCMCMYVPFHGCMYVGTCMGMLVHVCGYVCVRVYGLP